MSSTTTPTNRAAYLDAPKSHPMSIRPVPMPAPTGNTLLIRNRAIAINPIDFKLQTLAMYPLPYPVILGQDVAGDVISVGPEVTRFKPGDRVLGCAAGFATKRNEDKAFQEYTVLEEGLTSPVPSHASYEDGVVVPLAAATASAGLFQEQFLGLDLPVVGAKEKEGGEKGALLVWGAGSAVGANAVQLAKAAGYEAIATASARNSDYVTGKLGADAVLDYNNAATVVQDLIAAFKGKKCVGVFDAVGGAAWAPIYEFVEKVNGDEKTEKKIGLVATTVPRFPEPGPAMGAVVKQVQSLGIRDNAVGKGIFQDFLPEAMEKGQYVLAPEPMVAGHGLEHLQDAVDLLGKGVSNKKVVITL